MTYICITTVTKLNIDSTQHYYCEILCVIVPKQVITVYIWISDLMSCFEFRVMRS